MTALYMALKRLVRDEKGQGMVEYGLIIAVVALVALLSLPGVGTALQTLFTNITGRLAVPGGS